MIVSQNLKRLRDAVRLISAGTQNCFVRSFIKAPCVWHLRYASPRWASWNPGSVQPAKRALQTLQRRVVRNRDPRGAPPTRERPHLALLAEAATGCVLGSPINAIKPETDS